MCLVTVVKYILSFCLIKLSRRSVIYYSAVRSSGPVLVVMGLPRLKKVHNVLKRLEARTETLVDTVSEDGRIVSKI